MKLMFGFVIFYLVSQCSAVLFNSPIDCNCIPKDVNFPCATTGSTSDCTSDIFVNQSTNIDSLTVSIQVFHKHSNEIIITLISPDNTNEILLNAYDDTENISRTYPSIYHNLNVFLNKPSFGIWRLRVYDFEKASKTIGILWSLNINGNNSSTSTTIPTLTSTTSTAIITTSTSSRVNVSNLSPNQINSLLTSNQDVTPCLLNCSNHGQCVIKNTNQLVCECDQHYTSGLQR